MKKCIRCKEVLEDDMFHKRTYPSGHIGLQSYCKSCAITVSTKWNNENEDIVLKAWKDKHVAKQEFILDYKINNPCIFCGESDPVVLDFHHRNPEEKEYPISTLLRGGWSVKRVKEEISKCDVLCSNCHRKVHYNLY